MEISKNDIKEAAMATVKGAVSNIPIVGGLFAEYIGLAQGKIADKRIIQWMDMVEEKLQKLHDNFEGLANDELFYSCIQIATTNAMRAYQTEKRQLFANAIYNTAQLDSDSDKKLLFLSLLDRNTLAGVKLLQYYSENHYHKDDYVHSSGMITTHTVGGTEYPTKSILQNNPEFKNDSDYVKTITAQLFGDGLISFVDFNTPESPERARRKRTTKLGDEFVAFITVE